MANRIELPIKAMALDFDGVITNLDVDWNAVIRRASQIVGQDIKSLITFYENNHGTPIFQKVSVEMEKIELQAIKTAQPKPHIEDFLQKLKEKQVPVYIVSMQSLKPIKTFLDQHCLASYFNGIITRENCPSKPAQLEYISKQTGISPSQILLVDDAKRNIEKCKEFGAACFFFKREQTPKEAKESWNKILNIANSDLI